MESNHLQESETNNEKIDDVATNDADQSADNTEGEDKDLSGDAEKVHMRMPMELDLSDLAGALLLNHNQKYIFFR